MAFRYDIYSFYISIITLIITIIIFFYSQKILNKNIKTFNLFEKKLSDKLKIK